MGNMSTFGWIIIFCYVMGPIIGIGWPIYFLYRWWSNYQNISSSGPGRTGARDRRLQKNLMDPRWMEMCKLEHEPLLHVKAPNSPLNALLYRYERMQESNPSFHYHPFPESDLKWADLTLDEQSRAKALARHYVYLQEVLDVAETSMAFSRIQSHQKTLQPTGPFNLNQAVSLGLTARMGYKSYRQYIKPKH